MSELKKTQNFDEGSKKAELCINCHEFFGSTENLCSKCYKYQLSVFANQLSHYFHRDKSKESAKNNVQSTPIIISQALSSTADKNDNVGIDSQNEKEKVEELKEDKVDKVVNLGEQAASKKEVSTRCLVCSKKIGLLGFKCQCGSSFCRNHRLPEAHNCSFDFGKSAKDRLIKENAIIKAEKVQRF